MARLNHYVYSFAAREDYETKLYEIQKMLKAKNRSEALRGATDLAHAMQPLIHDDGCLYVRSPSGEEIRVFARYP